MNNSNSAKLIEDILKNDSKNFSTIYHAVWRQPRIRVFASFFTAPFLLWKIIQRVKDPRRRCIAKIGLVVGIIGAYLAGGLLGTATAALLIAAYIGLFFGLAFFVGTFISVIFTVAFQIFVFNFIAFIFLHLSSNDVLDYLSKISR